MKLVKAIMVVAAFTGSSAFASKNAGSPDKDKNCASRSHADTFNQNRREEKRRVANLSEESTRRNTPDSSATPGTTN